MQSQRISRTPGIPRGARGACFAGLALCLALTGCYSLNWVTAKPEAMAPLPDELVELAAAQPGGRFEFELFYPGGAYHHDPAEKDPLAAHADERLRFRRAEMTLRSQAPRGRVLADLTFSDGAGNRASVANVDLLRLIPRLDGPKELQYPELLLSEFTRFGSTFRAEHDEFELEIADPLLLPARDRAYRMNLTNNCLDPTKWEMTLVTADFSDFSERRAGDLNLNQNRLLSHVWFYLDRELYTRLLAVKNPDLEVDTALAYDYETLSSRAEDVVVPFEKLREVARPEPAELLEIAARSGRQLAPLDSEQHYKWQFGLFVNRERFTSYADLLEKPIELATYGDRGFYDPQQPRRFDMTWMKTLDRVEVSSLENPNGRTFVEIVVEGSDSPYTLRLGNVDLALLDEQRLYVMTFGVNQYPLSRRNSPPQATLHQDQDLLPEELQPYAFLVDRESGRFVDNFKQGLERIYLGWESIDRDVLEIYTISYERITPVWMARVLLNDELVDRARVRRSLYRG